MGGDAQGGGGASPPGARALGGGWAVAIRMRGPAARGPADKVINRAAVPGRRMAPPPVCAGLGGGGRRKGKRQVDRRTRCRPPEFEKWATVPGRRMAPSPVARALGGGRAVAISVCALATRRPHGRAEDRAAVPGRRMAPPPITQAWEEVAGAMESSDRRAQAGSRRTSRKWAAMPWEEERHRRQYRGPWEEDGPSRFVIPAQRTAS